MSPFPTPCLEVIGERSEPLSGHVNGSSRYIRTSWLAGIVNSKHAHVSLTFDPTHLEQV